MTEERPVTIEMNCETGEVITRPFTDQEMAQRKIDLAYVATQQAEQLAAATALAELKASAKAKLVAGDPLTPEEADTLLV
jgi:hypothetical protein